jgi:hypothetical protein
MPDTLESETTTALVPSVPVATPLPVFTGPEMNRALTAYRELQKALDQSMPDQIMELDGKPFRKKGYWRAIAVAFNLSVEPIEESREVHGQFEDGRDNFGYVVTYKASTQTGRSATGDGSCFAVEKAKRAGDANPWESLPKQSTEHNVRSHAHTRAFNRAVSNLVGFGEVSAEEVDRDTHNGSAVIEPDAPTGPRPDAPAGFAYIHRCWKENGWYHVLLPDASGGKRLEYKTKKEHVGEVAMQAFQHNVAVKVDAKDGWLNKVIAAPKRTTDAELDAEIAKQDLAKQAGEVA